ncbi:MAG TPA: hypothetical protein DDW17_00040 [Deltaproteobacteria bacterium]|nr:hypothetical protein [Deltaproteobacteria bacterium]
MKKVYAIPTGADFITELKKFISSYNSNLSNVGIVFPGKRPSLYMRKKYSEHTQTPLYAPRFFSMEEFIDYIITKHYSGWSDLHYTDALWLLYISIRSLDVFKDHPFRKKHFGDFFPWGKYLLDFINQLDMENVQDANLRSVEKNADIGYDVPPDINDLLKNIATLRTTFHNLLENNRSFTRGYKHLSVLKRIESTPLTEFEHIYFAGFFALTNTEKEMVRHLWDKGSADIIFQGAPRDWDILKNLVVYLGAQVEQISCETVIPQSVEIHSGFDTHSGIIKVYEVLRKNNATKTAIILPSSDTLVPLLTYGIDRCDTAYNISLGYPFERTSVYDLTAHILHAQSTRRKKGLYNVRNYLDVMLHPFVKNLSGETEIRRLLLDIEKLLTGEYTDSPFASKPLITLEEIEEEIKARYSDENREAIIRTLMLLHTLFFINLENSGTLSDVAKNLENILDYIHTNTPVRSYILSGEIFNALFELLDSIQWTQSGSVRFHRNKDDNIRIICDILLDYLKTLTIPFATQPIEPIEIIGVLESRNISFDTILILDLNEGVFPGPKSIDPLVPLGIYEKLGLPSPSYNEEIFRYYFYTLMQSAKRCHLFYIDTEEKPRSRYIEQVIWGAEKQTKNIDIMKIDRSLFRINLITQEALPVITKTEKIHALLSTRAYSATEIDDYLACPVLFYYKNILNFEQKRMITSNDIDHMERGEIIHHILRDTFEEFQGRELHSSDYKLVRSIMLKEIERHFRPRLVTGDYYLFKKLTQYKLEAFLKKYMYENYTPFTIIHIENAIEDTMAINGISVHFRGRIDRVDYDLSSDQYMVIDYKTGGTKQYSQHKLKKVNFNSTEDIHRYVKTIQLPIYIQLFHSRYKIPLKDINGKLILLRNNEEEILLKGTPEERVLLHELYMKAFTRILMDIMDIFTPFAPYSDDFCPECTFVNLCHR